MISMSHRSLIPKQPNKDLPVQPMDSPNHILQQAPRLEKLFGKDRAWLLIPGALPLPLIAFSSNSLAVLAWSVMVLSAWLVGKYLSWFE